MMRPMLYSAFHRIEPVVQTALSQPGATSSSSL